MPDYLLPELGQTGAQPGALGAARRRPCRNDDVDCWQFVLVQPKRFADRAAYAIARHGIADSFGCDRQAKARARLMLQSAVCPAKSIINRNDDLFGSSGIRLQ